METEVRALVPELQGRVAQRDERSFDTREAAGSIPASPIARRRRGWFDPVIRDYVYISDAKLDSIAEAIPKSRWKDLSAEVKLELPLVSLALSTPATSETRTSKVALVERYLAGEEGIGEVWGTGEPSRYFKATLPMQWGPFKHHNGYDYDSLWPMVWFAGETPTTIVGLAGSRRHLVGERDFTVPDNVIKEGPSFTSYSNGFSIKDAVLNAAATDDDPNPKLMHAVAQTSITALAAAKFEGVPATTVEFLARRIYQSEWNDRLIVLGSPIFVAEI